MMAAKVGMKMKTVASACRKARTPRISASETAKAGSLAAALRQRMNADGRLDRQQADQREGRHLGPERPIGDVEFPALEAEEDAACSDHDDQHGEAAIEAVDAPDQGQRVPLQSRTHQHELRGDDRCQREHQKMVQDRQNEVGRHRRSCLLCVDAVAWRRMIFTMSRSTSTSLAASGIALGPGLAAVAFEHFPDGLRHFAAAAVFGVGPVPGDALVEGGALRHRVGGMPLLVHQRLLSGRLPERRSRGGRLRVGSGNHLVKMHHHRGGEQRRRKVEDRHRNEGGDQQSGQEDRSGISLRSAFASSGERWRIAANSKNSRPSR